MTGQATATLRGLRMSPRKMRLLVDLVRGLPLKEALVQLNFATKHGAKPLIKLLDSAAANAAHNHQLNADTLVITTAFVDGGPMLHRWMPRAFGRATPLRKRSSHITIILSGEIEKTARAKKEVVADETVTAEEGTVEAKPKKVAKAKVEKSEKKAPKKAPSKSE